MSTFKYDVGDTISYAGDAAKVMGTEIYNDHRRSYYLLIPGYDKFWISANIVETDVN